jgi:hypothetical protein
MLKVTHDLSGNYNTRHNSTNIRTLLTKGTVLESSMSRLFGHIFFIFIRLG